MERFAEIIVNIRGDGLDKAFTYRVPGDMEIAAGSRVVVPFGGQRLEGYCLAVRNCTDGDSAGEYKEIEEVLDAAPVLTEELLALAQWGAGRWLCRTVDFLQAMIPAGLRWSTKKWVALAQGAQADTEALAWLSRHGQVTLASWQKVFPEVARPAELRRLTEKGIILVNNRAARGVKEKKQQIACLVADSEVQPTGKKQELALALLRGRGAMTLSELAAAGVSRSTVISMEKNGWVAIRQQVMRRDPLAGEVFAEIGAVTLTEAQQQALHSVSASIAGGGGKAVLLHGVTGSGKTEVYLQAIAAVASSGRGSIVLVPEIALTPQMIERFAARFGRSVAVLHSRLSAGERYDEWARIAAGEALVAVGARSAVFAPFKKLGLIILDEEHDAGYKQDEAPRYHARDVAQWRASRHGAALVLGSATPSLESYRAALAGEYILCSLPQRVAGRPLPPVEVVDMRQELKEGHRSIFSRPLLAALERVGQEGKQAILLLNRRGFATFVLCRECGFTLRCKQCNVSLKYHQAQSELRCHYCEHREPYPSQCPSCGGRYIRHFGTGTQKVEDELGKHFPQMRVVRLDADTTGRKGAHRQILGTFKSGGADVLVGTQMVAKGLDFPNVTLVGVITADTSINLPDFRAGERTFQLLTQVAGRAGRGTAGGQVLIQTYTPEHYAIVAAGTHDYEGFYLQESRAREELGYPPYVYFVRLLLTGKNEGAVVDAASLVVSLLGKADVLGPSPCPLERIKEQYRWQVVVRGTNLEPLLSMVRVASLQFRKSPPAANVRLTVDVEPQSLL